jgi:hypothetical protein
VKKKVTILTLSPGLFAFSAMHSAFYFLGAMLFALSIPATPPDRYSIPREQRSTWSVAPWNRRISARPSQAGLGGREEHCF